MPDTPLPPGYTICPVTGYLDREDGTGILPRHKTAFLKHFKKSGDKTKAIETQGFRYTDLEWHFHNDARFSSDFRETMLSMKHEIESVLYEQALKPSGHRSRQVWLETHFPEDYGKKALPKGQKNKSKLDDLLGDLDD